ncbi:MAG: AAA family ATPase, partial [Candidatus Aenigmarchaeota archaeon]|nr:AAA family ATPase [Candidatus Aenigmarchaeota archaeon]
IEAILKNTVDNISIKEKEYNGASKEVGGYDDKLDKMEEELEKLDEDLINSSGDMKKDNDRIKIERSIVERSSKMESYYREIKRLEEMINSLTIMKNTKTQDIRNHAVKTILDSDIAGIEGTISTLMSVEPRYQLAIETTAKSHLNDIIVQNENTAISCIRYLKENNAGRARLLPLERLNLYRTSEKSKIAARMPGFIDYAINLIDYNPIHDKAFRQVFKDTLIAENMDAAKKVRGLKVVTLDGDQFDPEGSISGGSRKGQKRSESLMDFSSIKRYEDEKERLEQSIKDLHTEITDLEKIKLEKEKGDEKDSKELEVKKTKKLDLKEKIDNIKKNRRTNMEESILLEKELQDLRIRRARLEAEYDNLLIPYEKYKDRADLIKGDPEKLERELSKIERQIRQLGPINMKAIEEYKIFREDYDEFEKKINKLEEERKTIIDMIEEIEKKRKELFIETFNYISKEFTKIYQAIAEGEGSLELENENNVESGLIIKAQPKDKKLLIIDALSGGEKTMTSIAFLFAIMNYKPSPFYILDEIDAALDTENSKKIGNLVTKYSEKSQFLIISHNSALVQKAKRVYGITMKKGASTIIGIELEN